MAPVLTLLGACWSYDFLVVATHEAIHQNYPHHPSSLGSSSSATEASSDLSGLAPRLTESRSFAIEAYPPRGQCRPASTGGQPQKQQSAEVRQAFCSQNRGTYSSLPARHQASCLQNHHQGMRVQHRGSKLQGQRPLQLPGAVTRGPAAGQLQQRAPVLPGQSVREPTPYALDIPDHRTGHPQKIQQLAGCPHRTAVGAIPDCCEHNGILGCHSSQWRPGSCRVLYKLSQARTAALTESERSDNLSLLHKHQGCGTCTSWSSRTPASVRSVLHPLLKEQVSEPVAQPSLESRLEAQLLLLAAACGASSTCNTKSSSPRTSPLCVGK
mmetsp:Transcript_12714/g.22501  ORF Transcript_12714/g.22501 Transcript_12714/m.22501 type:complete len:326 (+) Transcript_12714:462-1439(+)